MIPRTLIAALTAAGAVSMTVTAFAGPAMLTDLAGECTLTGPGGDRYDCPLVAPLAAGSRLELGADGRIVMVYLASGEEHRYTGATSVTVQPDGPEPPAGEARKLDRFGKTELAPLEDATLVQAAVTMRGSDERARAELMWPRDVTLMSKEPVFEWADEGGKGGYTVVVDREDGSRFAWIPAGAKTSVALPKTLEPGMSYVWRVEQRGRRYSDDGRFSVYDETESASRRERLADLEARAPGDDTPFSERVLFAAMLQANGFEEAARVRWRALQRERPDMEPLARLAQGG